MRRGEAIHAFQLYDQNAFGGKYFLLSVFIGSHLWANIFRGLSIHAPPSPPFPLFSPTSRSNSPPSTGPSRIIQPAVKPGQADRRSLVNPRLCRKQASRPGNIEERAGHGGESILWLIRTSRERREVTAKGNRRARLKVDSDTFLRPQPPASFTPGGLLTYASRRETICEKEKSARDQCAPRSPAPSLFLQALLGQEFDQVHHAHRVAPFVVVPGHH